MASRYGVSGGIVPYPGFRAGAGYEWRNWSFGVESGYTYIKGDNPLVTDIAIVPLLLKAGYSFHPIAGYRRFSLTPTAAWGMVHARVDHYRDVIDMLTQRPTRSTNNGFLIQTGLRAGWNPVPAWSRAFEIFAGLSIDGIIETGGLIPLPQLELGVRMRPFVWKAQRAAQVKGEQPAPPEPEEREPAWHWWQVLFPPDEAAASAEGIAALDEAGAAIRAAVIAGEGARVIVRGYAAPFVSAAGQWEISRARARYCAAYLITQYGIPEELITVEWYGAEVLPENADETAHTLRRSVEIIFEERERL